MGKNIGLGYRSDVAYDVKELINKVDSLTAEKESLEKENAEIKERNSQLENSISSLTAEKEFADKKKTKDEK